MDEFSGAEFEKIKAKGEELYKSFGNVYCPYFKENVSFNGEGLIHLKFKNRKRPRSDQDQYMRFKLLRYAREILALSHTVQGIRIIEQSEHTRSFNQTDEILEKIFYYEFVAVLENNRIRIIVKQIGSGEKIFWSIIPFWKMDFKTLNRLLHSGEPEED